MSTVHTIPVAQATNADAAQFAVEMFTANTANLATTDKKGNRVSFERSIVFASKDGRADMATAIYEKQVTNGIYTPLLADALMGTARNTSKLSAIGLCQIILNLHVGKTLKGQKAFYYSLVSALAEALAA